MTPRPGRIALWLLAGCRAPRIAHAEPPPPFLVVELPSCLEVSPHEVRRIVALELGSVQLLESAAAAPGRTPRVSATCAPPLLHLRAEDPTTGRTRTRTVDLGSSPAGVRARLLALTIAELAATGDEPLEAASTPPPAALPSPVAAPPVVPAATAEVPAPVAPEEGALLVGGGASASSYRAGSGLTTLGGGLQLTRLQPGGLGWRADVAADHGAVQVSLGSVTVDTATAAAAILLAKRAPWLSLHAGAGLRAGVAHLLGRPAMPDRIRGRSQLVPIASLFGAASATVPVGGRWAIEIAAEAGYALVDVGGLVVGAREVSISGLWLGLRAGVSVAL